MVRDRKQASAIVSAIALGLGAGILLTFLLSPRAIVALQATALIVSGVAYFICRR